MIDVNDKIEQLTKKISKLSSLGVDTHEYEKN